MSQEVIEHLSKHVCLTTEQKAFIASHMQLRQYLAGTQLLKVGEISNESFIVVRGCVRSAIEKNGAETTLNIYTEFQPILPLAYGQNIPSTHWLEALETTVVAVSSAEIESALFEKHPEYETVCRIMSEVLAAEIQKSLVNYQTMEPEERYLHLMQERPTVIQRVPQYHIASYLGIRPESLSRIRKRLAKKAH